MPIVNVAETRRGLSVIFLTDVLPQDVPVVRNIYGMRKKGEMWFAPGFIPFGLWVFSDIEEIPSFTLSKEASEFHKKLKTKVGLMSQHDIQAYKPTLKPYAHQLESLSRAIHTPRLGLFLDPGLGKTKIACDLIIHHKKLVPKSFWLIVALKVNQFTWTKEMETNSGGAMSLTPLVATGKKGREKELTKILQKKDNVGVVVTYDTCRVAKDLLLENIPFTDVVLDESHSLRTPRSGKTKAVLEILNTRPIGRCLLLSGTPSLGSPLHLWGQLKALGDFIVPSSWDFYRHHTIKSPFNKHIVTGFKNLGELNDLVTSVSLRKTAEECLSDLPERVIQVIEITPKPKTKKVYNATVRLDPVSVGDINLTEPDNPLSAMTRLAQISMGFSYKSRKKADICDTCPHVVSCVDQDISPYTKRCKQEQSDPGRDVGLVGSTEVIDAVCELVASHTAAGKKCIVWGKHRWVLDTLYTRLSKQEQVLQYDSRTKDHASIEAQFNSGAAPVVILAQISMGIGVTFKAPVMVYAELSWSLDHWLQSLDRNYGIRAKGFKMLLVQAVVIRGSVSHSIMNLLQKKIDVSTLMSKSIECVTCTEALKCLSAGIEPFDPGCILGTDSTIKTKITIKGI